MKHLIAIACLLTLNFSLIAQDGKRDLNFQQSPAKPAPEWVKLIDHGQFDARLKGYIAPEGLRIDIVSEAPDIINPVGMTFGPDGTLYVLEWVEDPQGKSEQVKIDFTYKDGSRRKVLIMRKPTKDRIKALTWNAEKKKFNAPKIILEEELPSSILVHDDWLYVSGQGTVRRYKKQADGTWGQKQVIAQGFCGFHHHQVSGLTIGNDGWLYITSGDDDNFVEGADGSRATVLRTGAIFRCRPDGSKMHVHSIGYRNPYRDVAFDDRGNMFHVDNDNEDGSKWTGCRLMHIPEGADFGWRLRPGANCCVPDFGRSAVYGELPGKMAPMLKTGRGAPAGLLIYNDAFLPPEYRGLLYYPDVFRKVIRAYQVQSDGATFEVGHEFEFLRANDPKFRPCQMIAGPDGAMYVCDWRTDSGGAGKLWGDGKNGRIYRITWRGTKENPAIEPRGFDSWAKLTKLEDEDLLKTFECENASDRERARHEFVRRGVKKLQMLSEYAKDADNKTIAGRIAALGAMQTLGDVDVNRLHDFSPDVRRVTADAIGLNARRGSEEAHEALAARINDEDLAVRRAVYLAIGRVNAPLAAEIIVNGLQFDKRDDPVFSDGLIRALEMTGKGGITKLLALADSGSDKDLALVLDVYPSLRTREAAEQLPALLKNYHVKPEQKVGLLRSFTYYQLDPPVSVAPIAKFLEDLPEGPTKEISEGQLNSMKLAALDVLASAGKIEGDRLKKTLLAMLKSDDAKAKQMVLSTIADAKLLSATPILLEQLATAEDDAARQTLIRTLGALGEKSAFKAIEKHLQAKDAATRIETLRALGNIDYGQARGVAAKLLGDSEVNVQREAVVLLGQSIEGARIAGKHFVDRKLPRALLPEVSESLRRFASSEHPDVTALLSNVLRGGLLVSLEPEELKRVSAMVKEKGDPQRGRQLYLNHREVACIQCHRLEGVGGNVGPDLTRLWDTHSLEKVIESMLDPSKEIKEGYQTYVATTKSGLVVSGLKVSQNAKELVLRDPTGKEVRIAAAELDDVQASKKSLMPDDVVRHLSFNEFIDLVAFLRDRKSQEELRGMILHAWAIGPLEFDLQKAQPIEKNPNPDMAIVKDGLRLSWRPIQADVGKGFDLRPVIGLAPASGYLLAYVHSPKEQKAKLKLQSDEKALVWLNGKTVDVGESVAPLALQQGWNVLLLRMNNQEGAPFLTARIIDAMDVRISLQKD